MKKKMVCIFILMAAVVFSTYPQQYNAESDFEFEIRRSGGVSFNFNQSPSQGAQYIAITGYNGTSKTVRIPPQIQNLPVTVIGDRAFPITYVEGEYKEGDPNVGKFGEDLSKALTSVTIPDSVTTIGEYAFSSNLLTNITIPNNVTTIGEGAFSGNRLTSVTISNSVRTIGTNAFSSNRLTSITIPNSVTRLSGFSYNQLTRVTIPDRVTSIGEEAFKGNRLTSITIPNSITSIGEEAFAENQLRSVTIPNSVTSIGDYAFAHNQLTSVTIPNSVTSIKFAFFDNPLTSISIGANLSLGGQGADAAGTWTASFNDGFDDYYNRNGKKAGTYTYRNGRWSMQ